jgi:RecA-family ATPase
VTRGHYYTLAELLRRPELYAEPPIVVPELLFMGRVTLLSAREKFGKTTFSAQLAAALSAGIPFLGDLLPASVVVWYALD